MAASKVWEEILFEFPLDMLALKFTHDNYFYLGYSQQMKDSVARVMPHWHESYPLYGSVLGFYTGSLDHLAASNLHQQN